MNRRELLLGALAGIGAAALAPALDEPALERGPEVGRYFIGIDHGYYDGEPFRGQQYVILDEHGVVVEAGYWAPSADLG